MSVRSRCALIAAAIVFSIVPSYAGPCLLDIDRMQASVDAVIAAAAVAGPPGRQRQKRSSGKGNGPSAR